MRYLVLLALVLGACGVEDPEPAKTCQITYTLSGSGGHGYTATYTNDGGGIGQESITDPNWSRSFSFTEGDYVSLSGLCFADDGKECTVRAVISRGSLTLYEATSYGNIGSADTSGSVKCE